MEPVKPEKRTIKTRSLHSKISTAILITCIAIALIFGAIVYPFGIRRNNFRYDQIRLLIEFVLHQKKEHLISGISYHRTGMTAKTIRDILNVQGIVAVSLYNPGGKMIMSPDGTFSAKIPESEKKALLRSPSFTIEDHEEQSLAVYTASLDVDEQHAGYVKIYYDLIEMERETRLTITFFIVLLLTVLLVMSFLLNFFLSRFVVRPVSILREAMNRVQEGHLGEDVRLSSNDEIGDMAGAFNKMSANLLEKQEAMTDAIEEKEAYAIILEQANKDLENLVVKLENEITERKRAKQALTQAEEKYRSIFENALEGIYQCSTDGRFISANPAMAKIIGYDSPDDLVWSAIDIMKLYISEEDRKAYNHILGEHGQVVNFKTQIYRKDKSVIWISFSTRAVRDADGNVLYYEGSTVDITEQKEKEAAFREREAAEAANRAKSEFLTTMSHEIRTPMNAILGFTELLDSKIKDEQQKQYLAAIISSGKILLGLINDILDLSKIEAGKLDLHYQMVNPRSVFNEIKQIFSQKAREKGLDFYMELDPSIPDGLLLDELRLRQIYLNLVGNAVKFTESGYIRLCLKKHLANKDGNLLNLIFSVEDTGIGMPETQKELIFDAFTQQAGQSSAKYGGTGLGLTITRRLVEMMGGEISVESVPGKGSTFHVILKHVSTGTGEDRPSVARNVLKDSIIFEKALILIADDIGSNRDLLKGFLESFDFQIIEAENGKDAVDLTEHFQPDIILMDIKMPVMDGYEATRKIRNSLPSIPIIAVTASVLQENEDLIKNAGCDGLLRKPVSKTELLTELIQYLPYSEKLETENLENEKSSFTASLESLSPEIISRLPELVNVLENEMTVTRDKLTRTFIFNEIEDFANQITGLGTSYKLDMLADWGNDLLRQAQSFDVEKLPRTLDYFTELVKEISDVAKEL